jgi:hypothetical protein
MSSSTSVVPITTAVELVYVNQMQQISGGTAPVLERPQHSFADCRSSLNGQLTYLNVDEMVSDVGQYERDSRRMSDEAFRESRKGLPGELRFFAKAELVQEAG